MQPNEFESELKDVSRYPSMLYELIAKAYTWHFEGFGTESLVYHARAIEFQSEFATRSHSILKEAQALSWPEDARILTMVNDLGRLGEMLQILDRVLTSEP